MASEFNKQFFFIPSERKQIHSVIHSSCVRLAKSLLGKRPDNKHALIPITAMGYIAILGESRILFANLKDEIDMNGQHGLLVSLAWQPHIAEHEDLSIQHIPMNLTYYGHPANLKNLQQQLTGEFYKALMLIDKKYEGMPLPSTDIELIDLSEQFSLPSGKA